MNPHRLIEKAFFRVLLTGLLLFSFGTQAGESLGPWNPFGNKTFTHFGNLPVTPNTFFWNIPSLHLGAVDLFQSPNTSAYSVHEGVLKFPTHPKNDLQGDKWITTLQILRGDGILTYYTHLDPTSIPIGIRKGAESPEGTFVEKGTFLGSLAKHLNIPSHLHFGVADCKARVKLNPLLTLDYEDTHSPIIENLEITPMHSRDTVSGKVELTANIYDRIDGMDLDYPPNRVEFSILEMGKNHKLVFSTLLFDSKSNPFININGNLKCENFLEFDGYEPFLGNAIYRSKSYGPKSYGRGFPYSLTSKTDKLTPEARSWFKPFLGPWNTAECDVHGNRTFPDGRYEIRIKARDIKGNTGRFKREFIVQNDHCAS